MAHELPQHVWRKASRSKQQGECVELADLPDGVAVRDSKAPATGHLTVDRAAFAVIAGRIRRGDYDL